MDADGTYRLLLAIIAYFALGAYYNYSTYGASGVDLIPYVTSSYSDVKPVVTDNLIFKQTPRLLARSTLHGPRCHVTPLLVCTPPTDIGAGRVHRCVTALAVLL